MMYVHLPFYAFSKLEHSRHQRGIDLTFFALTCIAVMLKIWKMERERERENVCEKGGRAESKHLDWLNRFVGDRERERE